MAELRVGIVGMGNMGWQYAQMLAEGKVKGAVLGGVVTRSEASREKARQRYGVPAFGALEPRQADAWIIATPHGEHLGAVRECFGAGRHVLVEKPLAAEIGAAREMVRLYEGVREGGGGGVVFGIMFNQRTNPLYGAMRAIVRTGEGGGGRGIGVVTRVTWIVSNWFRSNVYYKMSPWRATWKGEGGGVSINQCAHNLDLMLWITGLKPVRVTAVAGLGKAHPIECDDELSAIIEFEGGAVAQFVTTTAEWPGTNRLEIHGTRGKVVAEGGKLRKWVVAGDTREIIRESKEAMPTPGVVEEEVAIEKGPGSEHLVILQDFVDAIVGGRGSEGLIAPGVEGVGSLELSNGMLMAGVEGRAVGLPVDEGAFGAFLRAR